MEHSAAEARWRQRFHDFDRTVRQLTTALALPPPHAEFADVHRAGIIKMFEFTFELAWKTLKDYLYAEGVVAKSPRQTIQEAFQMGIVDNGHHWMEALEARSRMAHTYDDEDSIEAETVIRHNFHPMLLELHQFFQREHQ
jgi:nucleotidyltransferase substrate binding protein (TIGR01987 family)